MTARLIITQLSNVFARSVFTEGEAEAGAVQRAGPTVPCLLLSALTLAPVYCPAQ